MFILFLCKEKNHETNDPETLLFDYGGNGFVVVLQKLVDQAGGKAAGGTLDQHGDEGARNMEGKEQRCSTR